MTLDYVACFFTFLTASITVFAKGAVEPELLAFTLQIITDVVVFYSYSLRMTAEIENYMVSSQRIYQYCLLESEDDLEKDTDKLFNADHWPEVGEIEFK